MRFSHGRLNKKSDQATEDGRESVGRKMRSRRQLSGLRCPGAYQRASVTLMRLHNSWARETASALDANSPMALPPLACVRM